MLSLSNVEDFLDVIGITEYNGDIVKKDEYGDFIEVFDTEFSFDEMKLAVLENRKTRNLVVDNAYSHIEIHDTTYVEGYRVRVGILCQRGIGGFGTTIKLMVKTIEYPVNGVLKTFLGFEAVGDYLEKHRQVDEESL